MKVLITAGTWDLDGGKSSGLIKKMYELLCDKEENWVFDYYNGGYYKELQNIILKVKEYDVIFWMANVPNELEKVRDVKNINPFAIVIGSKRNHYDNNLNKMEYTFVEILNKSLLQRNNLTIEFSKLKDATNFKMMLFDPLGVAWYDGYDLEELTNNMISRIEFIMTTKRERTYSIDKEISIPDNELFFSYVREVAEIFHKTIQHAEGVTRFLGNASFRGSDGIIYVSRRDVDKALIDVNTFVASFLDKDNKVRYFGEYKPSKDTVVQTRLYNLFPNINYIIHSHCYAEDGFYTNTPVPCGALDEIDEIIDVVQNNYDNNFNLDYYKFNLRGHGCIIFAKTIDDLIKTKYVTRNLPEKL